MQIQSITSTQNKQSFGAYPIFEKQAGKMVARKLNSRKFRKMARLFLTVEDKTPLVEEIAFSPNKCGRRLVARINGNETETYKQGIFKRTSAFINKVCRKALNMNDKMTKEMTKNNILGELPPCYEKDFFNYNFTF